MNYEEAGVDVDKEKEVISALAKAAFPSKEENDEINKRGHFAGLMEFEDKTLAMSTDGVGTKLLVASEMEKYVNIGIDCIAMNVNDILSVGAKPLAFVDYLAFEEPKKKIAEQIGIGLKKGAKKADVKLLGGETATLSEIIKNFDIAGSCVGIANEPVLGQKISKGDKIIGIKSNGIHSNGLTLARKSIKKAGHSYKEKFGNESKIGEKLLEPTEIYVKPVLEALQKYRVNGLANITGGGLNNIKRLGEFRYEINNPIEPQEIFSFIQECGNISIEEMYNVFNMGIGYCLITSKEYVHQVIEEIKNHGFFAKEIGEIRPGSGVKIDLSKESILL